MSYRVHTYLDTYTIYELIESSTASKVSICPERGGIMLSYEANGHEFLYLDKETFYPPTANIRGGNPILFPICGQLPDERYEWEGTTYRMKNHGFARMMPWEVVSTNDDGQASLTLKLGSTPETKEAYPFDFELTFTYILKDGALTIKQEYRNLSERDMPMYAGFHPYFAADDKNLAYDTDAPSYLDCSVNEQRPFAGRLDLTDQDQSFVLIGANKPEIAIEPSAGHRIRMTYGEEFGYVYLWSVPGKPFVCVEPWMAKTDEFNRKAELTLIRPNESLHTELTFHGSSK
ncbi:aldose epimerase [Paenibacillus sp. MBLB4367]|uniref:aldose epimerase family protein n=1 Tax=Paenibacillus sp. MBLB4367 TaxID=3384767 RepID=UPI0039080DC0